MRAVLRNFVRLVAAAAAVAVALSTAVVVLPFAAQGIWRHAASSTDNPISPLRSSFEGASTVYAANGSVLARLSASVSRRPVPLSAVPEVLVRAVLDTEDHRFYLHGAVDVPSEIRALVDDSLGAGIQGGSDITQQLVKQVYLNSRRTLSRKIKEAFLAIRLQKLYTKNQILDAYLNTVYLGAGAYGVDAAAEAYWGEPVRDVTLPQAALLAGLIQDPSGYDPIYAPVLARERRAEVLGRMLHYHDITAAQYRAADATPLPTAERGASRLPTGVDGYYVAQVEAQLLAPGSPLGSTAEQRYAALFEGDLKIYTNLHPALQRDAVSAVQQVSPANSVGYREALVSIDPTDGAVLDMVPGTNYAKEKFDVVTQGLRQPGSGFKLFTLLPALEAGDSIYDPVDATSPCAIPFPGNDSLLATPAHNDVGDGRSGVVSIEVATAQSLNCGFLRLAHQVGLGAVLRSAEQLGVPRSEVAPFASDPSVVLGAASVSPLQMADAYATLANGGTYFRPSFVSEVVDRTGTVIYRQPSTGTRVIPERIAAEADAAFEAVVQSGTGTAARIPGREVAGKTGTSNGPTDAWFNGFTPQIETTVWMGYPPSDSRPVVVDGVQVYGGAYPAETVHAFLTMALAGAPVVDFPSVDPALLPPARVVPEVTGPFPGCSYYKGNPGYGACANCSPGQVVVCTPPTSSPPAGATTTTTSTTSSSSTTSTFPATTTTSAPPVSSIPSPTSPPGSA